MKVDVRRRVARTDIDVTVLGLGGTPPHQDPSQREEDSAAAAAWDRGVRYFDTAPQYGHGLSELRLGAALHDVPRSAVVLSTKVGRLLKPRLDAPSGSRLPRQIPPFDVQSDYTYEGVMRSFEDSLQRLGLDHVDILFIHDVDATTHGVSGHRKHLEDALSGGYRALDLLRSQGVIQAFGLGGSDHETCLEALRRCDFDCFQLRGGYSLLDQDALDAFLPLCTQRGASVVVDAAVNTLRPSTNATLDTVCMEYGVTLAAAALQFTLAHPAIVSVVTGATSAEQVAHAAAAIEASIPGDFWEQLRTLRLLPEVAPTPADI